MHIQIGEEKEALCFDRKTHFTALFYVTDLLCGEAWQVVKSSDFSSCALRLF